MNLKELKAAVESAISGGDVGFDHWRDNLDPSTILKLIAVCEAAQNAEAWDENLNVGLTAALKEIEK